MKIMENPIKMDDLGVPLFLETPKYSFSNNHEIKVFQLHFSNQKNVIPPKLKMVKDRLSEIIFSPFAHF